MKETPLTLGIRWCPWDKEGKSDKDCPRVRWNNLIQINAESTKFTAQNTLRSLIRFAEADKLIQILPDDRNDITFDGAKTSPSNLTLK